MAWPFAAPRPGQTMSYSSFGVWGIKFAALHLANGLFALTIGIGILSSATDGGRQIIVVLSTAQRSRCGNSRRAVISYEPVCGNKRASGQAGCACTAIPKAIAVASERDRVIFASDFQFRPHIVAVVTPKNQLGFAQGNSERFAHKN